MNNTDSTPPPLTSDELAIIWGCMKTDLDRSNRSLIAARKDTTAASTEQERNFASALVQIEERRARTTRDVLLRVTELIDADRQGFRQGPTTLREEIPQVGDDPDAE